METAQAHIRAKEDTLPCLAARLASHPVARLKFDQLRKCYVSRPRTWISLQRAFSPQCARAKGSNVGTGIAYLLGSRRTGNAHLIGPCSRHSQGVCTRADVTSSWEHGHAIWRHSPGFQAFIYTRRFRSRRTKQAPCWLGSLRHNCRLWAKKRGQSLLLCP